MTRNAFRAALSAAVIATTAFAAASVDAAGAESFTLVERATTDTVTDTGASGDSAGDLLTFANKVYDEANQTEVGSDQGFCIRTVAGKAWECYLTVFLKAGQITVEGPFFDGQDSTGAVTGGTGEYAGASGEMLLHARNAEGSEFDFKFTLAD
jgi:hypothetical protein